MASRELIEYLCRQALCPAQQVGTSFVESDDVGRSLAADRRQHAKTKAKRGEGDKGDQSRAASTKKSVKKARKK